MGILELDRRFACRAIYAEPQTEAMPRRAATYNESMTNLVGQPFETRRRIEMKRYVVAANGLHRGMQYGRCLSNKRATVRVVSAMAALLVSLLSGCAVIAVGDAVIGVGAAAVSVAATTVKVGAKAIGAVVDAAIPDSEKAKN